MTFTDLSYKIHYTRGKDIASATELPLFSDGDYFHVTGTTTIASFASLGEGMQVVLEFEDICTLTNSANLILGDNDITTEAGESYRFVEESIGVWRLLGGGGTGGGTEVVFDTTSSRATLGDRVDINGDFTLNIDSWSGGPNWAWSADYGGCAKHTPVSNYPLTGHVPVVEGTLYYGEITVSGLAYPDYIEFAINGDRVPVDEDTVWLDESGTYIGSIRATGTGDAVITITPSPSFDGQIESVKFYSVIRSLPAIELVDQDDEVACDISADASLRTQFMGLDAGSGDYTGTDNMCYGQEAGASLVTGSYNSFFGANAGNSCSMGSYNVCIGGDAGKGITSGGANTCIGAESGLNITSGARNTLIGRNAGKLITTGTDNTCVGPHTGEALTTGTGNVIMGVGCALQLTEGFSNLLVGGYCASALTTGESNVLFGNTCGYIMTVGSNNVAMGNGSLGGGEEPQSCVAIGNSALYESEGEYSIAIGDSAGVNNTTGSHNIYMGYRSGRYTSTSHDGIFIGQEAGTNVNGGIIQNTLSTDSIFIGRDSTSGAATTTNEIVIGVEAEGKGSNTTVIGDVTSTLATFLSGAVAMGATEHAAMHGAFAVATNELYSGFITEAAGNIAATLADGYPGQFKVIKLTNKDVSNLVVTPANFTDGTSITFDATGEVAILIFAGTGWTVIYTTATVA